MTLSLLPPNATATERHVEAATARLGDLPIKIDTLWHPETCPAPLLPWMAWALSVDDWDADWPDQRKRAVIAASVDIHRRKGTVAAIRDQLVMQGYGDAVLVEDADLPRYGDPMPLTYGGDWTYGPSDASWADYWVEVQQPISATDAERLAERLGNVAPARCRLRAIKLTGVFHTYGDGRWSYGDPVTYGGVYEFGGSSNG